MLAQPVAGMTTGNGVGLPLAARSRRVAGRFSPRSLMPGSLGPLSGKWTEAASLRQAGKR
jgi:hypothetical protein